MRQLEQEYQRCLERSRACAPTFGTISVGDGDWMDYHFKAEAIFGLLAALRFGRTLQESIVSGVEDCKYAISIWNKKREYQVRRWDGWAESYLLSLVSLLKKAAG